ncbi:MAG: hypothetical protein M3Q56_08540 [Bacteroidota bacterium]|nr:hypothetical protein [Bacteroidota bacterium]
MNKLLLILSFFTLALYPKVNAQDSMEEIPGDHFSLEGALELFKKANSPEDFEKMLNTEGNLVNNLDLNGDGEIDYVRVIDRADGDVHAMILQVAISEDESQDIGVIEIEKDGKESAILQIIGDEEIYGETKIIEPFEESEIQGDKKDKGPSVYLAPERIIVNVWGWPSVRFVYGPAYRPWVSPWRWRAYPVWFRPWRPHPLAYMHVHRPRVYVGFHTAPTHRVLHAHSVYTPHRKSSTVVRTKYKVNVDHRRHHNKVKVTKTTTTVKKQGGTTKVKRTKTTKTVKRK